MAKATTFKPLSVKIKTTIQVDRQRLSNLLCCAFEGGSNHWYRIEEYNAPKDENLFHSMGMCETFRSLDYPLSEGGSLLVSDFQIAEDVKESALPDGKPVLLNLDRLCKGLSVMIEKYPRHYADFKDENEDAYTGDVFLQCCIFGEVVYG
jgi:hypothetical protein